MQMTGVMKSLYTDLQVADSISCLALQRPLDVTVKLVDSAVDSRGHIECIVKLLHRLPALANVTTSDGRCALLDQLHQQIASSSQQTMQNITCLCSLLLVSTNNFLVSSDRLLLDGFSVTFFHQIYVIIKNNIVYDVHRRSGMVIWSVLR